MTIDSLLLVLSSTKFSWVALNLIIPMHLTGLDAEYVPSCENNLVIFSIMADASPTYFDIFISTQGACFYIAINFNC